MRPLLRLLFLSFALSTLATSVLAGESVGPGSTAPKLEIKTWLKGVKVQEFDPEKTYVVEFWATWCGPCIAGMPHLSELAKKNADVTFIGVGIWEDHVDGNLEKFVQKMGDKMDYNVAYSGNQDGMAASWMAAAEQNSIPRAFIVKDSKIIWVGHPASMDEPLAQIKAGTFDLAAFKKEFETGVEESRQQQRYSAAFQNANDLFKNGKREEARAALLQAVKDFPNGAGLAENYRYEWLSVEDPKAWEEKTAAMLKTGKFRTTNQICNFLLEVSASKNRIPFVRKAMGMVIKATKGNDTNANFYALEVYKNTGDNQLALDIANKILKLVPTMKAQYQAETRERLLKDKRELEAKLKTKK